MAIAESITRLVATFIAILQTRAELVAVEVEEEALRYFSYLLFALVAMFCLGVAIMLAILLIVAIYWDTHRIGVLVTLISLFAAAGVFIGWQIYYRYRHKPHLLEHTLTELSRDIETLKASP
jgi:uncharacterized membrane protein YqjE